MIPLTIQKDKALPEKWKSAKPKHNATELLFCWEILFYTGWVLRLLCIY